MLNYGIMALNNFIADQMDVNRLLVMGLEVGMLVVLGFAQLYRVLADRIRTFVVEVLL